MMGDDDPDGELLGDHGGVRRFASPGSALVGHQSEDQTIPSRQSNCTGIQQYVWMGCWQS